MKTVSGKVISSHQISLSKAAKYLSKFTNSPNEASPAFAAYLRRTSDAFNELVQIHKDCKTPLGEQSKLKNDNFADIVTHATATSIAIAGKGKRKTRDEVNVDEQSGNTQRYDSASVGMDLKVQDGGRIIEGDVSDVNNDLKKSKKKKKKNKERDGDVAAAEDTHGDDHDAIKVDDVKTEMRRLDGSEEMSVADVGAAVKKSKKKKAKNVELNGVDDGIEVKEVKRELGGLGATEEVTNNLPDVGVAGKKSKKKRGNDGVVSFTKNDQSHDAINPDVIGNKADGLDASEEPKKKKKSKRDKHQKENHSGATEAVRDVQLHPRKEVADTGEAADTVQNNGDERKKHKKKSKIKDDGDVRNKVKEEKESSSIKSAEQISEIKIENEHQVLSEKKQFYEGAGRENGRDMETEASRNKESRKRKHERVADGELEGSQETVKSKKKKL